LIDQKLNRPPSSPTVVVQFGTPVAPLAGDAKSHLRGELMTLRAEVERAIRRAGDRSTRLHLLGAAHRIEKILDPDK
jgi:hypothetical protein